ncbi:hypothetical protein SteCoe_8591 [Stentor coeruleus]|uniref:C2 domain-containing protein n=1 Tax=Stentor coeruleus TaxID=5963 RepID=A0A1R2CJT5_9CILI|nr:hypothetical protein SteCoe_8591 [Stentor coeruleus]
MVESYLSTKVEIFICARNLANMDSFSKSDPYCLVYTKAGESSHYHEMGQTEVISDNLNPNWRTTIICDYFFETKQLMKFSVYDYDDNKPDNLGEAFTSLGEIVGKGTIILDLSKKGKLIVRAEEVKGSNDNYEFHMKGIKLDKKDLFGKSDPYLIFYRSLGSNSWTEVYRTEIIKNTLDPTWKPISISGQKLCNGDKNKPIKIECFDWDRIGSHDLIGITEVTLEHLSQNGARFELFTPNNKNKGKNSGVLEMSNVIIKKVLSFIDYLRVGVQISFSLAIDYTGSNGEFSSLSSLHHINPNSPNQYEQAIWEVGTILEVYDTDKLFPVFGFGGVPRGEHKANHCFPLTFDISNPYVQGVNGILQAYRNSLSLVSLSGPTLFNNVIRNCMAVAQSTPPQAFYHILLILTDGAIMDMDETISCIVEASNLPMSIIIIGVGNADFTSMENLDCDNGVLTDNRGRKASRDIVQFVPFYKFKGNPVALAAEVLKEVPKQLTGFMQMINYAPAIPEDRPLSQIVVEATLPPLDLPSESKVSAHNAPEVYVPEAPVEDAYVPEAPVEDAYVPEAPVEETFVPEAPVEAPEDSNNSHDHDE